MPLTFPRAMPDWVKTESCLLRPKYITVAPRSRSGELLRVEVADAFWELSLSFVRQKMTDVVRTYTWWDSMEGGQHSFLCHDHSRPRPLNYLVAGLPATKAGGGAFDGSCDVDALTAYTITISGLPDSFVFLEGDYVGLVQGGHYGLHRVTADKTANSSGVVTVDVVPPVNTNLFDTDATAQVEKPVAEFVPMEIIGEPAVEASQVSITAVQKP